MNEETLMDPPRDGSSAKAGSSRDPQGRLHEGTACQPMCEMNIGDRWRSPARTITEADIVNFAGLTADFHPQHMDVTYAERSDFGARIAHGMLVLAYAVGLVPNDYAVAIRRFKHVVFKKPVFIGDTICMEGTVTGMMPLSEDVGMVSGRWRVLNQNEESTVKLEVEALWRRNWQ